MCVMYNNWGGKLFDCLKRRNNSLYNSMSAYADPFVNVKFDLFTEK